MIRESEAQPQSKDPLHACATGGPARRFCNRAKFSPVFSDPTGPIGSSLVGALQEAEQRLAGRSAAPHVVIHQQKFFQLRMIESLLRAALFVRQTRGARGGIGVERRAPLISPPPGQNPGTDHLVRVGLAGDRIGSRPLRSTPPGEASDGTDRSFPRKNALGCTLPRNRARNSLKYAVAHVSRCARTVRIFGDRRRHAWCRCEAHWDRESRTGMVQIFTGNAQHPQGAT